MKDRIFKTFETILRKKYKYNENRKKDRFKNRHEQM